MYMYYSLRSIVVELFCYFGMFHSSEVIFLLSKSQHISFHLFFSQSYFILFTFFSLLLYYYFI